LPGGGGDGNTKPDDDVEDISMGLLSGGVDELDAVGTKPKTQTGTGTFSKTDFLFAYATAAGKSLFH